MSWIDDRIADLKMFEEHENQVAERRRLISEQAEKTYGSLWDEIKNVLKEFESRGLPSYTNGSPLERIVRRSGKIKLGKSSQSAYEIQVCLSVDRQSISVTGDVQLRLQFDLCEDDVLCMKLLGEPISLRDAANKILDQFYFPELQPAPAQDRSIHDMLTP